MQHDEALKTLKVVKVIEMQSCLHCTKCSTAPECINGTIIQLHCAANHHMRISLVQDSFLP